MNTNNTHGTSVLNEQYALRDYQVDLVQKTFASWEHNRRLMLQLPTGAGKTVLFAVLAREFLQRGLGVLVLAHRKELITQAAEKLEAISGLPVGIIKAGFPLNPEYETQVASVQSLTRRKWRPEAGLIICDEAHHSCAKSYTSIFEAYPEAYILGVTATPCRSDGQGFKFLYDDLIVGPSVPELINQGYLSKIRLFAADKTINTRGVRTTGGDYNQSDLAEAIDTSLVVGDIIESWEKFAQNKQTVVFCVDIAHSIEATQAFINAGYSAEHLDGETPDQLRDAIITRFRSGETKILCNCGIVTEGFDVPNIEAIQCVRPTKSLILWLQMVGRALRPSPGKENAIIIDHSDNWEYLGLPDEERNWSLDPISLKELRFNQECPDCSHIFKPLPHELKPHRYAINNKTLDAEPIYRVSCPNCQCSFEFGMGTGLKVGEKKVFDKDEQVEIGEIRLEVSAFEQTIIDNLLTTQQRYHFKPGWVYYHLLEDPAIKDFSLGAWRYVATKIGYKNDWATRVWLKVRRNEAPNVEFTG